MRRNGKLKIFARDIGDSTSGKSVLFELSCGRKFWLSKRWLDCVAIDDTLPERERVYEWYAPRHILVSLNLH